MNMQYFKISDICYCIMCKKLWGTMPEELLVSEGVSKVEKRVDGNKELNILE